MTCRPIALLSLTFGVIIGALIVLLAKILDWGTDAELRQIHHVDEADEHTYGIDEGKWK